MTYEEKQKVIVALYKAGHIFLAEAFPTIENSEVNRLDAHPYDMIVIGWNIFTHDLDNSCLLTYYMDASRFKKNISIVREAYDIIYDALVLHKLIPKTQSYNKLIKLLVLKGILLKGVKYDK